MFDRPSGTDKSPLLTKLFQEIEHSADQLRAENARLGQIGRTTPSSLLAGRVEIGDGIWMDIDENGGAKVQVSPGSGREGVRIRAEDIANAQWLSFSYRLPVSPIRSARYLGILSDVECESIVSFKPCARYIGRGGFKDDFSAPSAVFLGGRTQTLTTLKPNKDYLATADSVEILFFFDGRRFDLTLRGVENLLI